MIRTNPQLAHPVTEKHTKALEQLRSVASGEKAEVDHKGVSEKFERCLRGFQQLGMSPQGAVAPLDVLGGFSKTCDGTANADAHKGATNTKRAPVMLTGGSKVNVKTEKRPASAMLVD